MDKSITDSISLKFLKSHALFGGIEDDDLVFFLSLMKQENHSGGDVIVSEGETGDCLYLIVEGSVEILKNVSDSSSDSMERIATLGTGETFGEMAIIDLQKRSATVRTLEQTIVLKLSHKNIFDIAKKNNYIYSIVIMNLAREISRRLRVMDDRYAITLFSHKH